jgi:hypothetical protein
MARYSRVGGPAIDSPLAAAFANIPGLSISRTWDDGPLILICTVGLVNGTPAPVDCAFAFAIDGAPHYPQNYAVRIPNGAGISLTHADVVAIAAGRRTITVQAQSTGDPLVVAEHDLCSLTVLQLPQWDDDEANLAISVPFP